MSARMPIVEAPLWKKILAWVGLALGALMIAAGVDQPGARSVAGMVLFGLALVLPSAWWMWCQGRDARIAAQNADLAASNARMRQYLTGDDAAYAAALDEAPTIPGTNRRWNLVAPASFLLVVIGVTVSPTPEPPERADVVTPPATSTTASSSPVESVSAAPTTRAPVGSTAPAEGGQETTPAPEPERQYVPVAPVPDRQSSDPSRSGGGVYYKSCAQARAAGAAPLNAGSPGYRPGLDRDGDGVACDQGAGG